MSRGEGNDNGERISRLAIDSPEKAAEELRNLADALAECRNKSDITFALSEIFCVSERTIYRDMS